MASQGRGSERFLWGWSVSLTGGRNSIYNRLNWRPFGSFFRFSLDVATRPSRFAVKRTLKRDAGQPFNPKFFVLIQDFRRTFSNGTFASQWASRH